MTQEGCRRQLTWAAEPAEEDWSSGCWQTHTCDKHVQPWLGTHRVTFHPSPASRRPETTQKWTHAITKYGLSDPSHGINTLVFRIPLRKHLKCFIYKLLVEQFMCLITWLLFLFFYKLPLLIKPWCFSTIWSLDSFFPSAKSSKAVCSCSQTVR